MPLPARFDFCLIADARFDFRLIAGARKGARDGLVSFVLNYPNEASRGRK